LKLAALINDMNGPISFLHSRAIIGFLGLLFFTDHYAVADTPVHSDVRESNSKPFWLDRSMFVHDGWMFVVGVASSANTIEEGRSRSLEVARAELRGISPKYVDQDVETKEIYEERAVDGTYTVYRLIMVKLRDWSPYFVDKEKAEEVARILERDEARKKREAQQELDRKASIERDNKRARALGKSHIYLYVQNLKWKCEMKADYVKSYQRALTEEGREPFRKIILRQSRWLFERPTPETIEREIDRKIEVVKRDMEDSEKACEELKEADILVAKMELEEQAEKQRRAEARQKWEEEHKRTFFGQTAKVICVVATVGLCGFFIQW
jgi:hypothetical protein